MTVRHARMVWLPERDSGRRPGGTVTADTSVNPSGLCMCGCGLAAPLATRTDKRAGIKAGQPQRFVIGHRARLPGRHPHAIGGEGPNPSGICQCGCGESAPVAVQSDTRLGNVKGQPARYRLGHRANAWTPEQLRARALARILEGATRTAETFEGTPHLLYGGYINDSGYGETTVEGEPERAHRAAWRLTVGPIPDGMTIDHRCHVRACIEVRHIRPLPRPDNSRNAHGAWANVNKTHCPHGHPYDAANTIYRVDRKGRTGRGCRTCKRKRDAEAYAARKRRAAA